MAPRRGVGFVSSAAKASAMHIRAHFCTRVHISDHLRWVRLGSFSEPTEDAGAVGRTVGGSFNRTSSDVGERHASNTLANPCNKGGGKVSAWSFGRGRGNFSLRNARLRRQ